MDSTLLIVAVSGSRGITSPEPVARALEAVAVEAALSGRDLFLRLGDAHGVDSLALRWARAAGVHRRIYFADRVAFASWQQLAPAIEAASWGLGNESAELSADWELDGPSMAGSKRNAAMLYGDPFRKMRRADLLVAVHDGVSPGTLNCVRQAELMEIEVRYELVV